MFRNARAEPGRGLGLGDKEAEKISLPEVARGFTEYLPHTQVFAEQCLGHSGGRPSQGSAGVRPVTT